MKKKLYLDLKKTPSQMLSCKVCEFFRAVIVSNCEQLYLFIVGSVHIFTHSIQEKLPLGILQ